ncbi:MAG TPA: radical SAM protein [Thermoguttaceae bacterium]|nr:radical SAM protein [Thermoguttaceae bacterium]
MHVVLWDTRKLDVSKDFAGGFGIGMYRGGGGLRGRIIRRFFTRDRRPVALLLAHLAAIFHRLGHRVEYSEDRVPSGADLYIFCPSLITLHLEREAIARVFELAPKARVLVVGPVASTMPEAFDGLGATIVKGEAEQLLWKLDEVLARPGVSVQLGTIEDLDLLPPPDWSPFSPRRFRVGFDFSRFPTALIQSSRGCTFRCNYCPYTVLDNSVRFRDPQAVADEIGHGMRHWGFRSFKFRDALFGLNHDTTFRLAELIGRLPRKIQFSIETRIDIMRPELLRVLRRVGLSSITVGIETPDDETLRHYHRRPIHSDHQRRFVATCREMGIRTVAGFMIGFPGDTEQSIRRVMRYARAVNPTFANFNIVTPYPGTEFFEQMKDRIADLDFSHYSMHMPVLKYEHLTTEQVAHLHAKCFSRFHFRWRYLLDNAHFLWPSLQWLGIGRGRTVASQAQPAHPGVPRPLSGLDLLQQKGLRQDSPHKQPGISDQASDRYPAE